MVITKIVVAFALLVGALTVAHQQRVFERAGFTGSCVLVRAPVADAADVQWWSCKEGLLTGYPTLLKDNCDLKIVTTDRQVWRCPTPIERPSAII